MSRTIYIKSRPYWIRKRPLSGHSLFDFLEKDNEMFVAFKSRSDGYIASDVVVLLPRKRFWNGWGKKQMNDYYEIVRPLTNLEIGIILKNTYCYPGVSRNNNPIILSLV